MNSIPTIIAGTDCIVDGKGDLDRTRQIRERLSRIGANVEEFTIASLNDGWHTPLPKNRLRCACAPMEIIIEAQRLFSTKQADAVVIDGTDHIKSDFQNNKEARNRLMQIYQGNQLSILQAYDQLTNEFLNHWNISPEEFSSYCELMFENHFRVWRDKNPDAKPPDKKWFAPVTDLFRGVDCANPSVDFEGCLILTTEAIAKKCGLDLSQTPQVIGCHVEQVGEDSIETIPQIASYHHLNKAYEIACRQAEVDFSTAFLTGKALLETYTCYPVVPLGFLLSTGLVPSIREIPDFLESYPLTITGGLNLAKAAWNNSTLYAFVQMAAKLTAKETPSLAGIHSVGAIGYKQAFAILQIEPTQE